MMKRICEVWERASEGVAARLSLLKALLMGAALTLSPVQRVSAQSYAPLAKLNIPEASITMAEVVQRKALKSQSPP